MLDISSETREPALQRVGLGDLRPYPSLLVTRLDDGNGNGHAGIVEELIAALPPLLEEVLLDRFLTALEARLGTQEEEDRERVLDRLRDVLRTDRGWDQERLLKALRRSLSNGAGIRSLREVCGWEEVGLDADDYRRRLGWTPPFMGTDGELEVGFRHYLEQHAPSWYLPTILGPIDRLHQLIVVCRYRDLVSLYASEPAARGRVARQIYRGGPEAEVFKALLPIEAGRLNAAFVKRDDPHGDHDSQRRIRTLWMSGTHRSTPAKADGKVLIGPDLENALDPLGDQPYYFTAARCRTELSLHNGLGPTPPEPLGDRPRVRQDVRAPDAQVTTRPLTVGVAPRRSRLWAAPVPDWEHFRSLIQGLLEHIRTSPVYQEPPLAVLASPLSELGGSPQGIRDAYDLSIIAPELLSDDTPLDPAERDLIERWSYDSRFFAICPEDGGPHFKAKVALGGSYVGEIRFHVDVDEEAKAQVQVEAQEPRRVSAKALAKEAVDDLDAAHKERLLAEAVRVCRRPSWLTVRYESGHTLSDGAIYSVRHRDVRFENWRFVDLSRHDVGKEKPAVPTKDPETGEILTHPVSGKKILSFAPEAIGQQDSLFCWVQQNWSPDAPNVQQGWLACDDGAGEIADFIHFDPLERLLTLIHVKASGSTSAKRQISTSDYEVVVGQAVKNLRFLDRVNLAGWLENGQDKKVATAVWYDGDKQDDRSGFIAAIREAGEDYGRRVVIFQPRVTASEYKKVQQDLGIGKLRTSRVARMQQLDTLLVGAQADCRQLGAELVVIGESV